MIPKLVIYENKKEILNEDNYYELFEQDKFKKGYKGYLKSKYDLSIENQFSINIPVGILPIFNEGGIMFMPIDKPFPNNMFFIETEEEQFESDNFESEAVDQLSEEIEEDGEGIFSKISIGKLTVIYTWVSSNQFKFYIHNGENAFRGYGFYLDDMKFERKKIKVENWLRAFRENTEIDKDVIVDESRIVTDRYEERNEDSEILLDVFLREENFDVNDDLKIPSFKNFERIKDLAIKPLMVLDEYEIRPLILTDNVRTNFSSEQDMMKNQWIIFEQEFVSKKRQKNKNYKGNTHKNNKEAMAKYEKMKQSVADLTMDRFNDNDLEFYILSAESHPKSVNVFINAGTFMYFVNCRISDYNFMTSSAEIIKKWIGKIERTKKLNN